MRNFALFSLKTKKGDEKKKIEIGTQNRINREKWVNSSFQFYVCFIVTIKLISVPILWTLILFQDKV